MSYMTAGKLQAFEALMKEVPGFDHYDSGSDGICPECRSCRFHRPHWKYQSCVYKRNMTARLFTLQSYYKKNRIRFGRMASDISFLLFLFD